MMNTHDNEPPFSLLTLWPGFHAGRPWGADIVALMWYSVIQKIRYEFGWWTHMNFIQ